MHKIIVCLILFIYRLIVNAQLIKVSERENIIKSESKDHRCVLDQKSKLIWEVKLSDKGLQDENSSYIWFDV
ncbi:hypothetical protein [Candidatus Vesicomyidisocius sp. SY067_SCS001]|uniref:hypothetical protein n=1 Tax=Candidatus Vesicomyidisocius sp. SY067_SCS001 TaxID=2732590 RepID=UPI001EEDDA21|nr:hypothetical protein [Candidatus Vesicomyosocius sp. SY067_SCS001]